MTRWRRAWLDDDGRHALAIVRICVALSVLASLARLAAMPALVTDLYRPVGLWMIVGETPPPPFAIAAMFALAWLATVAMLLGLCTRLATAVSFVAGVALASLSTSHQPHWSHVHNIVFLAQLALLGARTGDALSLDALVHPHHAPGAYPWSLRLVQLAVALVFVGAAFHKLAHGDFTLRWALSDNLRHQLVVRYDLAGLPRPALVDWLIADAWRYRTAAFLNLVTQLAPLLVVVVPRRPRLRMLAGGAFVVEILAIGLVFDLWNLHWLPLAAVFFVGGTSPAHAPPPRAARVFAGAFLTLHVLTSFVPTLDRRLNAYPFSAFPMFASIRARAPYDQHLPYTVLGDHFDAGAISPAAQAFLDHHYRGTYRITDPSKLRAQLMRIRDEMNEHYFPDQRITRLVHHRVVFEIPAYPAPARCERRSIESTAILE